MKKRNIHSPVPETIQYMVEGQQKYPNNINAQKKEEKTDTDQVWQAQTKESVESLSLARMQEEALSLMLQARNWMLPNAGYLKQYVFFIAYKLNFIGIGYRQNLCMFKNHHFTKCFLKLGTVVCVCLCSERPIGIILTVLYGRLQSKGKGKMQ